MQVQLYRNERQSCWSVRWHAPARVVAHTQGAILDGARWSVSATGRGFIAGDLRWLHPETFFDPAVTERTLGALFTPARHWDCTTAVAVDQGDGVFIRRLDGAPLTHSQTAILAPDGRAYAIRTNACAEALEEAA